MDLYHLLFVFMVIGIFVWILDRKPINEGFTMSECPNCSKRDKFQCFQCDTCVWCWNKKGYGECVQGDSSTGPHFRTDCTAWQSQPDPYLDYQYYLPGWRQWWWWTAPESTRDRLKSRYNFRQENVR